MSDRKSKAESVLEAELKRRRKLRDEVVIYSSGICYCSICVPKGLPLDDVVDEVNRQNPSGVHRPIGLSRRIRRSKEENQIRTSVRTIKTGFTI